MTSDTDWDVPAETQPDPKDYSFDLDTALSSVVGLRATTPEDAFTAEVLGTERIGNGVIIRNDGLILTIGYLVTEAEDIWLSLANGQTVPGHAMGFDQSTGFGLVQALGKIDLPALPLGHSDPVEPGDRAVLAGAGGRSRSVAANVVARQEFAGYWEYVLDEALFTAPSHPHWGGTGLIGPKGDLLGIGSLQLEGMHEGARLPINMVVPIDLAKPVIDDLLTHGGPSAPPRPWLGLYADRIDDRIVIMGVATGGPADRAELRSGDIVLSVAGKEADDLAGFFRLFWALGEAGVEVPLKIWRDGDVFDVTVNSGDRTAFLKTPSVH